MYEKIKPFIADDGVFYALLLIAIGVTSFGLGRWSLSGMQPINQPASIIMTESAVPERMVAGGASGASSSVATTGTYVASKNGSKYHLPYCPGAQQMKEENKVWFSSKEEAEAAGYTPAANCKGI